MTRRVTWSLLLIWPSMIIFRIRRSFLLRGALSIPYNNTNTLYNTLNQQFTGARDISTVNQALGGTFVNGTEYEEVESARLLDASEYTVNTKLGYISLKNTVAGR